MLKKFKLLLENQKLRKENEDNRCKTEELEFQLYRAKVTANETLSQLYKIEEMSKSGLEEQAKRRNINVAVNEIRRRNINILKELEDRISN